MTGECIVRLAIAMEADPDAGLIQTLPLIINRNTFFARLQQFAAKVYGPVIATGLAVWMGRDGNYWGHNAIIRTRAFAEQGGLPDLKGKPPFGGHILSHDFVEAALLRRAGWDVYMLADLQGSYEESPPSLIDLSARDRRWCQGNLQHMRVVMAKGLKLPTRQHFATGIMSYLASPFWLFQLIVGIALVLQTTYIRPEYFARDFRLYPIWPRFDPERALGLFAVTMGILIAPKIFGLVLMLLSRQGRRDCGGGIRLVISALIEIVLSALLAPIQMLIQSGSVFQILLGRDTGWQPQRRDDGSIPIRDIVRRHRWHTLLGVFAGVSAFTIATSLFLWMSPTIVGLLLAIPLSLAQRPARRRARAQAHGPPPDARGAPSAADRDAGERAPGPQRDPGHRRRGRAPGALRRPAAPGAARGDAAPGRAPQARGDRPRAGARRGQDRRGRDHRRGRPVAEAQGAHGRPARPGAAPPRDAAQGRRGARGGQGGGRIGPVRRCRASGAAPRNCASASRLTPAEPPREARSRDGRP
jgi:hypothetical protein